MIRKVTIAIGIIVLGTFFSILGARLWFELVTDPQSVDKNEEVVAPLPIPLVEEEPAIVVPPVVPGSSHIQDVPFLVQAPFGEWSDTHFQNACEEASLTMVKYWYDGKSLSKEEGKKEILAQQKFQEKRFDTFVDTSIDDTKAILEEYYNITNVRVAYDIVIDDIGRELEGGNIVILPADGRVLKNPNFTPPGPTRHMLVVVGYDAITKEYITNDPGTRNGKDYRYDENILYDAILDYATGDHIPPRSDSKVMLVVSREP